MRAQRAYINRKMNVPHNSYVETITDKNVIERICRNQYWKYVYPWKCRFIYNNFLADVYGSTQPVAPLSLAQG